MLCSTLRSHYGLSFRFSSFALLFLRISCNDIAFRETGPPQTKIPVHLYWKNPFGEGRNSALYICIQPLKSLLIDATEVLRDDDLILICINTTTPKNGV